MDWYAIKQQGWYAIKQQGRYAIKQKKSNSFLKSSQTDLFDGILTSTITPDQSGPGSNGNEGLTPYFSELKHH